jgi:LacI family transcriptional regulator
MATIKDVARRAEVSTATVSNVLTGRRFVSEPLRAAVLRAVEELDYRPNAVARTLKTRRTNTIGVLVPDVTNPFFNRLVKAIGAAAGAAGYQLLFASCEEDPAEEARRLEAFRRSQVDGLIITPAEDVPEYLGPLAASDTPVVILDRGVTSLDVDSVTADNRDSARAATEHLLELGHRRISFLFGDLELENMRQRRDGVHDALRAADLDPAEARVVSVVGPVDAVRAAMADELRRTPRSTAVFAANNRLTLGAIQAIRQLELAFPEAVSLVGFDDFEWSRALRPFLTTIAQPTDLMGTKAWALLARRLEGDASPPTHEIVPCTLCVRESTRPLRKGGESQAQTTSSRRPVT